MNSAAKSDWWIFAESIKDGGRALLRAFDGELNPCPFCGSTLKDGKLARVNTEGCQSMVHCLYCGASAPLRSWNLRFQGNQALLNLQPAPD